MATSKKKVASKKTAPPAAQQEKKKTRSNPERIITTAGQMRYLSELPMELAKQDYVQITGKNGTVFGPYNSCMTAAEFCDAGRFHEARAVAELVPAHSRAGLPHGFEQMCVRQGILTIIAAAETRFKRDGTLGFVPWSNAGDKSDD